MPAFEHQLIAAIEACGTAVETFQATPRPLTSLNLDHSEEAVESQAAGERIRQFRPDTILSLYQIRPDIDSADSPIALVFRATYRLSLQDVVSEKTVWQSQISLATGNNEAVPTLVHSIVDRLSADGILRSCPAVAIKKG
jgi:hypothetical protein